MGKAQVLRQAKGYTVKDSRKLKIVKRNRKERRKAEVYRLTPLLERFDSEILGIEKTDHFIEGQLDQYVVVSVPECTNMVRAEEIKAQVMALVKKPVVVVSHNISLLKAVKLSASEAAAAIKQGEEYEVRTKQNAESVAL